MENYHDILARMNGNREKIRELEQTVKNTPLRARTEPEIVEAARKIEHLKIENMVLRDNARRSYYAWIFPQVLAIWNSAAGKPYGPKMKERLQNTAKERLSCSFYVEQNSYSAEITLVPLDKNGYSGTDWNYRDFEICTVYENGNMVPLLDGNRIVARETKDFELTGCGEYAADPAARAWEIIERFNVLKQQYADFQTACDAFNDILPSGVEGRYADRFKNYLYVN